MARRVLITGASGPLGKLVLRAATEDSKLEAKGVVRSPESAEVLKKETGATCEICNLTDAESVGRLGTVINAQTVIFCHAASPKKTEAGTFEYPEGGLPEQVDWQATRSFIDMAKAAGVEHVIVVGSQGGTTIDNMLNKLGGGKMILLWKRKAEKYLMASGLKYTIIHPGGLKDGPGGERQLHVGIDDQIKKEDGRIMREDLAKLVVGCVTDSAAVNRSFDVGSFEPGVGAPWDRDVGALLAPLNGANCGYSGPQHPILDDP